MSALLTKAKGALKLSIGTALFFATSAVQAQVYNGGGVGPGMDEFQLPRTDLRSLMIRIIQSVLSFLALAAVATIIIAGIYLIVGLGSDESKEKAKKIIQYTLIGLVIVLFSRVIVSII